MTYVLLSDKKLGATFKSVMWNKMHTRSNVRIRFLKMARIEAL